jgi:hypothetical protein
LQESAMTSGVLDLWLSTPLRMTCCDNITIWPFWNW